MVFRFKSEVSLSNHTPSGCDDEREDDEEDGEDQAQDHVQEQVKVQDQANDHEQAEAEDLAEGQAADEDEEEDDEEKDAEVAAVATTEEEAVVSRDPHRVPFVVNRTQLRSQIERLVRKCAEMGVDDLLAVHSKCAKGILQFAASADRTGAIKAIKAIADEPTAHT